MRANTILPDAERTAMITSLEGMLQRFTDSSSRLEAKYQELLAETERLRAELREKDETIRRSERLSVLGEMAAALAHEVRNPLGAISLFTSMLRQDVGDREAALPLVEEISKSITTLNGVVSNVLDYAKGRPIVKAPVNLHAIIAELHQHFQSMMNNKDMLELNMHGSPFAIADETGIRQVLYNLMINATQAVNFNGRVRINCTDAESKDWVEITVSDEGPGVPNHLLSRLFEPFVSGRSGGTGLGLSIVRRMIEAHGGSVSVRNNNGAEFTVKLPRKAHLRIEKSVEGGAHDDRTKF